METRQIEEESEKLLKALNDRLDVHDDSMKAAQEKINGICEELRTQVKDLEERADMELEEKYVEEDTRLQTVLDELYSDDVSNVSQVIQKAKIALIVTQSYDIVEDNLVEENDEEEEEEELIGRNGNERGDENESLFCLSSSYRLKTKRKIESEFLELRKPTIIGVVKIKEGEYFLHITCFNPDELKILSGNEIENQIKYKFLITKKGKNEENKYTLKKVDDDSFILTLMEYRKKSAYKIRVKTMVEGKESEWSDEIELSNKPNKTIISEPNVVPCVPSDLERELERIIKILRERLEIHDESRRVTQEKLCEICEELTKQINVTEERVIEELEVKFTAEDDRLQSTLNRLRSCENEEILKIIQRARAELIRTQSYDVVRCGLDEKYELKTILKVVPEMIKVEKPSNLAPSFTEKGEIALSFAFLNEDEEDVLKGTHFPFEVQVKIWGKGQKEEDSSRTFTKEFTLGSEEPVCFRATFTANTQYCMKIRIVHQENTTQWSDEAEFTTPEFEDLCVWKECPDDVDWNMKYSVDEKNPRIATKTNRSECTIIGNTPLPLNKVTSWSIKVLKSYNNDGYGIFVGVAPFGIDPNVDNYDKCGWYLYCYSSKLLSGPPHNYRAKDYGPKKEGKCVHTRDSIGVVMDTAKGDLSFVLDGVNCGVAYEGIPLDKPLAPCVILRKEGDSVELDTSEVKKTVVDSSISVPSNLTTESTTCDSITLRWDAIEGASFYQIEVDGSKVWGASTTNTFTKRGFLPETEHTFKVRAVRGNSVSEWCGVAKEKTLKAPVFSECVWKKCPDYVDGCMKYSVDEKNSRIATKIGGKYGISTIIGNATIPPNKVTSWSIKILKSKDNDGSGIYIGVAPSSINQNEIWNYDKCGWYFGCYDSALISGPPHSYKWKDYGPRKEDGEYVHTGDSVGVVMNTTNGELSFVLDGANLGVAYDGIPLGKPLVPCVILGCEGDSVELVL